MSRGSGSSLIPVAVFLAILLIALPTGADNVTVSETTNVTPTATITSAQTANITPTITTTQTANATPATTVAPTQTTAAPVNTTVAVTRLTTILTSATPTVSGTVTTGTVNVYSSPTGASILLDGVYAGTTPKTVNGVPAGNHILRLTLSEYYDYEGSIYVVAGQPAQGYGTLQPMNQVTSAAPSPVQTAIPVIVPVVAPTPVPTQDPGPLGNSGVVAAIIGATAVIIGSAATIFTHVRPPKKE
jgi:hypothetical protein